MLVVGTKSSVATVWYSLRTENAVEGGKFKTFASNTERAFRERVVISKKGPKDTRWALFENLDQQVLTAVVDWFLPAENLR